jgi:hypothetical protein
MKLSNGLLLLMFSSSLTYSSSLMVYQDKSTYSHVPSTTYIGFAKGLKAKCNGNSVELGNMFKCSSSDALCQDSVEMEEMNKRLSTISYNNEILDTMLTISKPSKIDATGWINSAKELAKEKSNLFYEEKNIQNNLEIKQKEFTKKVSSTKAVQTKELCNGELELTFPSNSLSFSTSYKANIEANKIEVTQYLNILNRSGVDIEVDNATFYYRLAQQYVRPAHFNPWVVSKYVPQDRLLKKRVMSDVVVSSSMSAIVSYDDASNIATYVDAREYNVTNLKLPSTGNALEVELISWSSELSCKLKAYPYLRASVFEVCSFKPKYQIEQNRWRVKSNKETINENAIGEYVNSTYNIYTKKDDDLKIVRAKIVDKERETGFFGGTARKKDGFVVTVSNKSNRVKKLTVVERIPTANTDEIEVKLLSVKSKETVDYRLLKDGKIEINLNLKANESKKIEILFELVYDKKLKIKY